MRPLLLVLALLPVTACGVSVRSDCQLVAETDLDDAEVSPLGYSADDLLAAVVGAHVVSGTLADSSLVDAEVSVLRATGSARLVEQDSVTIRTPNGMLSGTLTTLEVPPRCLDMVRVPVTLRVATVDGTILFDEVAVANADEEDLLAQIDVESEVPVHEVEGLPTAETEGVESAFAMTSFLTTGAGPELPAEITLSGKLGWQGESTRKYDDGAIYSAWAEYLLDW